MTSKNDAISGFEDLRSLNMPLESKLTLYAEYLERKNPEAARGYEEMISRLTAAGAGDAAVREGEMLPGFAMPDMNGRLVMLEELLTDGPLVISFNRGHWCSFCRLELLALGEIEAEVRGLGARTIAIWPERAAWAKELCSEFSLPFDFLIDIDNGYALQCGLAVPIGDALRQVLHSNGVDLDAWHGNGAWMVPIPATYVIRPDGMIHAAYIQPDFRRRMRPDAIISAVKELANR